MCKHTISYILSPFLFHHHSTEHLRFNTKAIGTVEPKGSGLQDYATAKGVQKCFEIASETILNASRNLDNIHYVHEQSTNHISLIKQA